MSSGSVLDQVVKGAAPPGTTVPAVASRSPSPLPSPSPAEEDVKAPLRTGTPQPSDPLASLPSSPPQIYLNLLILEASLRSQYLELRARRRTNTFFLFLLAIWLTFFFYALFLQPREDGIGLGGSVYWVVESTEKVALLGGVILAVLIWGTGQWERGVRWPRRFVGVANRGLRTMNCKIVVLKGPWWKELLGHLSILFPYSSLFPSQGSSYHYIDASMEKAGHQLGRHGHDDDLDFLREEDLAPGGDYIRLLLLPKPFSPDFRENWELYRTEYWEKENERRAALLRRLKAHDRQKAREQAGWLWWTGWRGWKGRKPIDLEKSHARAHNRHLSEKDGKRPLVRKSGSHSRSNSRGSTPSNPDIDDRPPSRGSRRLSNGASNVSDGRRRSKLGMQQFSKLTPASSRLLNTVSNASPQA